MNEFDLLVTGVPRSGTTAVIRWLAGSGKYNCLSEPFMCDLPDLGQIISNLSKHDKKIAIKEVFQIMDRSSGGDTTMMIPWIANGFARKTVWIIRDPRDVWCSMQNMRKHNWFTRTSAENFCDYYNKYLDIIGNKVLRYDRWADDPITEWYRVTGETLCNLKLGGVISGDRGCPRAYTTEEVKARELQVEFNDDYKLILDRCYNRYLDVIRKS